MITQDTIMDSTAKLLRYQHGIAYYGLSVPYSECLYSFPVPLNEMDQQVLCTEEKAINFFKYIRQAIKQGTLNKENYQS